MKTRGSKLENGGGQTRSVLECGGQRSATPLSDSHGPEEKRRRRCALPAQSKTWQPVLLLLLLSTLNYQLSTAQPYAINWHTINGGGGTSTGGVYSVSGTIGQPDAGPAMTNGHYSVTTGFWALPTAVQTTNAPTLTIVPAASGHATISWTPTTPGFVLQETWVLSPANWTISPSGITNPIVVPALLPTKFYRLFKP